MSDFLALVAVIVGVMVVPMWILDASRIRRQMIRHSHAHGRACRCSAFDD